MAELLIGFRNGGVEPVKVSGAMASFHFAERPEYIFNFTYQSPNPESTEPVAVDVGEELTFRYYVGVHSNFPYRAAGYRLALSVFYSTLDRKGQFATTPLNATLMVVEPPTWFDYELMGVWVMIGGVAFVVGLVFLSKYSPAHYQRFWQKVDLFWDAHLGGEEGKKRAKKVKEDAARARARSASRSKSNGKDRDTEDISDFLPKGFTVQGSKAGKKKAT